MNSAHALLGLLLAGFAGEHPLPPEPPHGAAVTAEEFLWQAAWLSDDARAGRDTDSDGGRAAAAWLAGRMKAMGLEAPEGAPGHLRPWTYRTAIVKEECLLEVVQEGGQPRPFAAEADWVLLGGAAKGPIEAPAVFAGYGITAPDLGYDDYKGLDCKGKVVVVLRHEPREKDPKSRWNGDRASPHSSFFAKASVAAAAGASALVVVNDPLNHEKDLLDSMNLGSMGRVPLPVLHANRAFAEEILGGTGDALRALQKAIDDADAPVAARESGARVRLRIVTGDRKADNVCGVLRGSDPVLREEWVVVGAHYDHVGLGQGGGPDPRAIGQIHNGADDNASGTAAMLEVAESFALGKARPRRSLLFLAFSGEEKGLLGSAAWVKDPAVPLDRIVAMINLDMVGRYRPGMLDVVAAESGSTLKAAVDAAAEGLGLEYRHTNEGIRDSDGWNFFQAKIPTVFFFTGLHGEYHRPPDDWWLLNAEGAAKIAEWTARTVRLLADADGRPAFVPVTPRPLNRGNRVVLGVNLSDAPEGTGAVVDGVTPRSAAERAGLKAGDRIVALGTMKVKDADGLRAALNLSKPGDTVVAKVVRGTESLELPVTFGGRSGPVFGVTFDAGKDGGRGVLVQEVAPGSVAEAAGVKPGDRIVSFGGKDVPDAAALPELLRSAKAGEKVKVKVLRESKELELEAAYPAAK
jgi:hypothetical protein